MNRKQQILTQAQQKLNGTKFAIKSRMIDIEDNGNPTNVTCLTWLGSDGKEKFISVEFLDMVGIN